MRCDVSLLVPEGGGVFTWHGDRKLLGEEVWGYLAGRPLSASLYDCLSGYVSNVTLAGRPDNPRFMEPGGLARPDRPRSNTRQTTEQCWANDDVGPALSRRLVSSTHGFTAIIHRAVVFRVLSPMPTRTKTAVSCTWAEDVHPYLEVARYGLAPVFPCNDSIPTEDLT